MDVKKIAMFGGGGLLLVGVIVLIIVLASGGADDTSYERVVARANEALGKGVLVVGAELPKMQSATVDIYLGSIDCDIEGTVEAFPALEIDKVVKGNLPAALVDAGVSKPAVVLNGDTRVRVVSGDSICSERVLSTSLCNALSNVPGLCGSRVTNRVASGRELSSAEDAACYDRCFVSYTIGGVSVDTLWQGPPCDRVPGYTPGVSTMIGRACLGDTCETDPTDLGCCAGNQCVWDGQCYNVGVTTDVGDDSEEEVCALLDTGATWIDPDGDSVSCQAAGLDWFSCSESEVCKEHDVKGDGMCCGDDTDERRVSCIGSICDDDSVPSCCTADSCAFGGRCYASGCAEIKTASGSLSAYCDAGRWIDLDTEHCAECMGDDSWTGDFCCGDDLGEGRTVRDFVFHTNKTKKDSLDVYCVDHSWQCISFEGGDRIENGCYDVPLRGKNDTRKYFCKSGDWYSPDYSERYCSNCGFSWVGGTFDSCCGDDESEYLLTGSDGSIGCCTVPDVDVAQGQCLYDDLCGNGIIDIGEACELGGSSDNEYCTQEVEECNGFEYGIRDSLGMCSNSCQCAEDDFEYSCVKGQCGAECSVNKDCADGETCSGCLCVSEDEEVDLCPAKIILNVSKSPVFVNDTFELIVDIVDKRGRPMGGLEFWLDIIVNEEPIGSRLYLTGGDGRYIISKFVTQNWHSGVFKYIAKTQRNQYQYTIRTDIEGCNPAIESTSAEFIIDPLKTYPVLTEDDKEDIRNEFELDADVILGAQCGNSIIEIGESCEGTTICRGSFGCDYEGHTIDVVEICSNCECPLDRWSEPNSDEYCTECFHCGDGIKNCGEACDGENETEGTMCFEGAIYAKQSVCYECTGYNETRGELIDECFCDCGEQPVDNCIDGDYVVIADDHFSGCSGEECNSCACGDTYHRDVNNDGIDDKCGFEMCGNKLDDDDDGVVDEPDCEWYYCSQCGQGAFNSCDATECSGFSQGCMFEEAILGTGFCTECALVGSCYGYDAQTCGNDPCGFDSCLFSGGECCTDMDGDGYCDHKDNCPAVLNPLQTDTDRDGFGDECDLCPAEAALNSPERSNEIFCSDGVDNDCDGIVDCADIDCNCEVQDE